MVETEFSLVRLGDEDAVTRPSHVNLDRIVVQPRDQASATRVSRGDA